MTDNNTKENCNENIGDVLLALKDLKEMFDSKISNDEWKNQKYDEMHMLMLKYQDDIVAKTIDPILRSLVRLSDSIRKDLKYYEEKEDKTEMEDTLLGIIEQIDAILFDYDIETYSAGTGIVNSKEQKIVRISATEEGEKDNCVSEILSVGYKKSDKIFRAERVEIYKYNNKSEEKQ